MFKFLLATLIIEMNMLMETVSVESDEIMVENRSNSILPLILVRTQNYNFIHPIDIPEPKIDDGNFLQGTIFTAKEKGDLLFFCGQDSNKENDDMLIDDANVDKDSEYCSYELSKPKPGVEGSNFLKCNHEPEPFVQKLFSKNEEIPCESIFNQQGKMYGFAYEVKTNDNGKIGVFDVYRFCYCEINRTVLFTEHVIAAPNLLKSPFLERERDKIYEMSDKAYNFFGKKYQKIKNKYQRVSAQQLLLQSQKLVPSEDMAFALWRKTTFHFLNVRSMKDEKIQLWDYINQLIRQDAIKKSREYHVYTGAFDLTDQGKDEQQLIRSPDIWVKVVHYKLEKDSEKYDESLAIVMNHNPNISFISRHIDHICEKNLCENSIIKKFSLDKKSVCCSSSVKFGFYFNVEFNTHQTLMIDSLTDNE